jgi:hypothetical protein
MNGDLKPFVARTPAVLIRALRSKGQRPRHPRIITLSRVNVAVDPNRPRRQLCALAISSFAIMLIPPLF